jgi:uridine phosphorylase
MYPILEFDFERDTFIDPHALKSGAPVPEKGVGCFFQDVIRRACAEGNLTEIDRMRSEHETQSVYELNQDGERLAVFNPGVGGPLAAGRLEALVANGLRKVVVCGSAGALIPDLAVGHVVVPSAAIRDEGTSYHYLPPGREIGVDVAAMRCIEHVLREREVPYVSGKTWTTDGIFRETRRRAARRRDEGCITVEMEAASLLAVARVRGIELGYLLYAGDSLAGDEWDHRNGPLHAGRHELFRLAAAAAARL